MGLLLISGFEKNSNTLTHEWTAVNNAGAGTTITTTSPRTGTYAGQVVVASGDAYGWLYEFLATASTGPYYAKFAFKYTVLPSVDTVIMALSNAITFGTIQAADVAIKFTTAGKLQLWNNTQLGSDSAALTSGTWYEIEMYFDNTPAGGSKVLNARLNQSQFAGSTTITALNTNVRSILLGGNLFFEANATGTFQFDDIELNDGTGSFRNTYPGSTKVAMLLPTAAGDANTFATQTGGTAGAANNFTRVNQVTPDDATTFNGSSTLNETDMFNVTDLGLQSYDTVNVVAVDFRFRNSTADTTAAIRAQIKKTASGTIAQSASLVPNSTVFKTNALAVPNKPSLIAYQDPDAASWTNTTVDSMQIGYKLQTAPGTAGRRIDVTQVVAYVSYTPGTPPPPPGGNVSSGMFALVR